MRVDIWSDVVCPWCYVGKARFENALRGFGHSDDVEVVFRSFELDPGAASGGRETNLEMISKKFGMPMAQARQMEERVAGLARAEGLQYQLERPSGNTFDLHRVLQLGREKGVQGALIAAVYEANFADARQIFDREVVTEVAAQAGLDAADVSKVLDTDEYADAVRADEQEAGRLNISGVPFFVFDMALGVSGAQSTEVFTQALAQAWEKGLGSTAS
ncbi:MAG TPA: DsbA family oxidoreductase [Trebonia sp.]|jgi:predicted DsbA family dithiol-disulfide isomerase|nr:DsbA family oxidoreductase [Trebonia sp.]